MGGSRDEFCARPAPLSRPLRGAGELREETESRPRSCLPDIRSRADGSRPARAQEAATSRTMRGPPTLALLCLALAALLSPPVEAWYKQAAGPSYYSVGRASGLLSGIRRSPYMRRSDDDSSIESGPATASLLMSEPRQTTGGLRNMAVCVKEVAPELQSCQLLPGVPSIIQCKADVTVSLDPADCTSP